MGREAIPAAVDEQRLVALALEAVGIPSPTGEEQAMGEFMRDTLEQLGLQPDEREPRAASGQPAGALRAYAACRACDQDGLALKGPWSSSHGPRV